jgi:hypothetical protein
MAGLSYPFDSGPGSTITEDQWSYLVKDSLGDGVHEDDNAPYSGELEVFTTAEPGIINIRAGRASIDGFHYQQSGDDIIAVTANANVTLDRMDAVVLRLDLSTDAITVETKLGVPASSPSPPAIDSNEMVLALFVVPKNSSTVLDVTDMRTYVGRRMLVSRSSNPVGRQGDLVYFPDSDRWSGVRAGAVPTTLAFEEEIDDHIAALDPHPQYWTPAEGKTVASGSSGILTAAPLVTTFGAYCRGLKLPGGEFWIVHLYLNLQWNGADNPGNTTLVTINVPELRPNFSFSISGNQYEFANSTDDIPLIAAVNPSGSVQAGGNTWLMGGARLVINTQYFTGPGV